MGYYNTYRSFPLHPLGDKAASLRQLWLTDHGRIASFFEDPLARHMDIQDKNGQNLFL